MVLLMKFALQQAPPHSDFTAGKAMKAITAGDACLFLVRNYTDACDLLLTFDIILRIKNMLGLKLKSLTVL